MRQRIGAIAVVLLLGVAGVLLLAEQSRPPPEDAPAAGPHEVPDEEAVLLQGRPTEHERPASSKAKQQAVDVLTIRGVVVSKESGDPIRGADVFVDGIQRATTDADGRFAARDVSRKLRMAQLRAEADGYTRRQLPRAFPKSGDLDGVRIELWRSSPIAGRVVDQHGVPVEGAGVSLLRSGRDLPFQNAVKTDRDGRFRFRDATAHEWSLQVVPPRPYGSWKRRTEPFLLVRGGTDDIEITLERVDAGRARVVVTVHDATSDARLEAAKAMLIRQRDDRDLPSSVPVLKNGVVSFEAVHPGTYVLWVRVVGRPASYRVFDVGARDGEITLRIPVITKGALATIHGRVDFGSSVRPKSLFAWSSLTPWSRPAWANKDGKTHHFAQVGEDGSFKLEGLLPGRYKVSAAPKGWRGSVEVHVGAGETAEVTILPVQMALVQLKTTGVVPEGTATVKFLFSKDGEAWSLYMNLGGVEGKTAKHSATLEPGRWHWKVVFDADNFAGGNRTSAQTQTGVVEVAVGDAVAVDVPVKPRDDGSTPR